MVDQPKSDKTWRFSARVRGALIALRNNPTVDRILAAHPSVARFVVGRFSRSELLGLRLTVGVAIGGIFLFLFLAVVQDLLATDPLVQADLRIMSLLQVYRSPTFDQVMLFVTYLGNWQVIHSAAALVVIYLALSGRWLSVVALSGSLLGGEALVWAAKYLFGRPRPDLANALVVAHGPSFPSGHAFVAFSFYGLVACLVADSATTWPRKVLVSGVALFGIAALGFSRIYLGVHWPSDVLASFALGAFWLTVILTSLNIAKANRSGGEPRRRGRLARQAVGGVLVVAWVAIAAVFYITHPLIERQPTVSVPRPVAAQTDLASTIFSEMPRFTEDITGTPIEPVNAILVGTPTELGRSFELAQWRPADPITLSSSWRLLIAQLFQRPDPTAPGLPVFWRGQPNPISFERPTPGNSAQERHHLHLWQTKFVVGDRPVWIGTVHLDKKGVISKGLPFPIHEIDPAVDKERDGLLADLVSTRCVRAFPEAKITQAMSGKNELGNPFFTDGKAIVVSLDCR
jgi:membrane-associated phospholipid phosphatase